MLEKEEEGFVSSIFLVPKKRGASETCSESPPPQSVHSLRTFQNGGDSHAEGSVKKR